jgi:hypothetical protein
MAGYSVTYTVVDQATAQIEAINRRIRQMREPIERQARALQQFVDLTGIKKVAEGFREIARTAGEAFESMSRLVPVMGILTGAASLAGIAELVKRWADFGNTLQLDATRIGTTTDQLEDLENATELAGGNTKDMVNSLKGLSTQLYQARINNAEALAWFRRFNIAITDVHGNLRKATDVMPEVIRALQNIHNPAERARVAIGLLGTEAGARLAEALDRSGHSWQYWVQEAQKYQKLTQQQQQDLVRYNEAIGALDVAFSSLKNQVGATIGEALTPFIKDLADWVRVNQPQIVAAIHELVREFANWIKGIDWTAVRKGADGVIAALKFIVNNLDTIKTAAEAVAAVFAIKWGIGIVANITAIVRALGVVGAAGGVGTGLLGALGLAVWLSAEIYRHWDEITAAAKQLGQSFSDAINRIIQTWKDFWSGRGGGQAPYSNLPPGAGPPRPGPSGYVQPCGGVPPPGAGTPDVTLPDVNVTAPRGGGGGPQGALGPVPNIGGMTPTERNQLALIERYESQGRNVPNFRFDPTHTAQGYYQITMSNWRALAHRLGITAPTPMQASRYEQAEVALALLRESGIGNWANYNSRLRGALARGEIAPATMLANVPTPAGQAVDIPRASGAPVQVTGGPPVSGKVDVAITHRNAPVGTSVVASGSGDVSVAPPRVEYSQLAVV